MTSSSHIRRLVLIGAIGCLVAPASAGAIALDFQNPPPVPVRPGLASGPAPCSSVR